MLKLCVVGLDVLLMFSFSFIFSLFLSDIVVNTLCSPYTFSLQKTLLLLLLTSSNKSTKLYALYICSPFISIKYSGRIVCHKNRGFFEAFKTCARCTSFVSVIFHELCAICKCMSYLLDMFICAKLSKFSFLYPYFAV